MSQIPQVPNLSLEKDLIEKGFDLIAGADEVGRGAWAGPLVASVVVLDAGRSMKGLKDSKKLTMEKREALVEEISSLSIDLGVGRVEPKEIDKFGLTKANFLAVQRALESMSIFPQFLLMDGRVAPKIPGLPSKAITKGDNRSQSIAAASVIAKITRDNLMKQYAKEFQGYGFAGHKGYGTRKHKMALKVRGPCRIHRKSFKSVSKPQNNNELGG